MEAQKYEVNSPTEKNLDLLFVIISFFIGYWPMANIGQQETPQVGNPVIWILIPHDPLISHVTSWKPEVVGFFSL